MKILIFIISFLLNTIILANYTLTDLIKHTLNTDPQIKVDKFRKMIALEAIKSAKFDYYPKFNLNIKRVEADKSDVNYSQDNKVRILSITQPLYAGGVIDANLDKAKVDLILKEAIIQQKRFELINSIVELFANFYQKTNNYQFYLQNQQLYKLIHNKIKNKFDAEISALSEYNLITEKLSEFNYKMQSSKLELDNILTQLSIKTDLNLTSNNISLNIKKFNFTKIDSTSFIENHYKILQMKAKINILKAQYTQEKSQILPKLNLRIEHQKGNFSTRNFNEENRVFLELSSPFGFGSISNIRKSKLEINSLKSELSVLKKQIKQEFKFKYLTYQSLEKKIKLTKDRIKQLDKILNSKHRLFIAGKILWQDLLNTINEKFLIKHHWVDLSTQYLKLDYYFSLLLGKV